MNKIVLDCAIQEKFHEVERHAEICDESGEVLGYFVRRRQPRTYEEGEVPYTDEELERAAREPGGRSLAAILADLEGIP